MDLRYDVKLPYQLDGEGKSIKRVERLLYYWCSRQQCVVVAVGELENIFLQLVNNQAHNRLTTAHAV